jgi:hypothetical protein
MCRGPWASTMFTTITKLTTAICLLRHGVFVEFVADVCLIEDFSEFEIKGHKQILQTLVKTHSKRIRRGQRPALSVFYGEGPGVASRVSLVPLTMGATLLTILTTTCFALFVSWISSVVILDTMEQIMWKLERRFFKVPIALHLFRN